MSPYGLQPLLNDLDTCLLAPTVVLSARDGQIGRSGAQGVFSADLRVLSTAELSVGERELEPISSARLGATGAEFVAVLRSVDDPTPDPTLWLRRRRTARPDGMDETFTISNIAEGPVTLNLNLTIGIDLADVELVKSGRTADERTPLRDNNSLRVASDEVDVRICAPDATLTIDAPTATAQWRLVVPSRGDMTVSWTLRVEDAGAAVVPAVKSVVDPLRITADDHRIAPFVATSTADLQALQLTSTRTPTDTFLGAGAPWYLTLFGRDSIWAARMSLLLGPEAAAGTLRTLAAFQGTQVVGETAEEPGKIPHEVRRPQSSLDETFLPPVYYGTIDATPLWVSLLVDAWRRGMDPAEVADLVPAAEAALQWMVDFGDADGDGFLEYQDVSGRGLSNQGWKDSGDSVRYADGRIADGPVALAEVQAYAYEAAIKGADLLDAFGRPGGPQWRRYAADLAARFRRTFWTADDLGRYPALALAGDKSLVDAPASNMGHLLGTGLLNSEEARAVADRLLHPTMSSGFGLRTMSTTTGGYSPLSYHCGSVWPHDTAIAVQGLQREGLGTEALELGLGVLAAGTAFGGRLPELFGGFAADDLPVPAPYPASCRPQAWAAASAVVLVQTCLGLTIDLPNGTVSVRPPLGTGAITVEGIRVGDALVTVALAADGSVAVTGLPAGVRLLAP